MNSLEILASFGVRIDDIVPSDKETQTGALKKIRDELEVSVQNQAFLLYCESIHDELVDDGILEPHFIAKLKVDKWLALKAEHKNIWLADARQRDENRPPNYAELMSFGESFSFSDFFENASLHARDALFKQGFLLYCESIHEELASEGIEPLLFIKRKAEKWQACGRNCGWAAKAEELNKNLSDICVGHAVIIRSSSSTDLIKHACVSKNVWNINREMVPSAYTFFSLVHRSELKAEDPNIDSDTIASTIDKMWANLTIEEKAKWVEHVHSCQDDGGGGQDSATCSDSLWKSSTPTQRILTKLYILLHEAEIEQSTVSTRAFYFDEVKQYLQKAFEYTNNSQKTF